MYLLFILRYLGEETMTHVPILKPGAYHHARWMVQAVYVLKLYLLQYLFRMKTRELIGVIEICYFVALVYVKLWCHAPRNELAPRVDLEFLQDLETL